MTPLRRFRVAPGAQRLMAVVALLPALLLCGPARGGSLWGMEGLGLPVDGYDLEARGAGSTAIGVADDYGMSMINPALIAWATSPQASFGYSGEEVWISGQGQPGTGHLGDSQLTGGRVVLPGPGHLRWGFGYRDLTDGTYRVQLPLNQGRPDHFERDLTGSGGIGELSGTLAALLLQKRLALGGTFGLVGGSLRDVTQDNYDSTAFSGGKTTVRTRVESGHSWSLGMQARPVPPVTIGAVYHGKSGLNLSSITTTQTGATWGTKAATELPPGLGLGFSCDLGRRARIAFDYDHLRWSATNFSPPDSGGAAPSSGFNNLRDTSRFGIGFTLRPGPTTVRDPLLRRSVWRIGFTERQLPVLQSNGAGVSEWSGTLGLGLPVQVDRGFVDFLLEMGRRGSLATDGLQETFVRLGVGVTFGRFKTEF